MKKPSGVLAVISGFSGAGKGTLMKELQKRYPNYALSVSCTTRAPREGEVDGREYYFIPEERFLAMARNGELLEHACYCGCYYGTPRAYVEAQMAAGRDVLLEIDMQGGLQIKRHFPEAVLIFVATPDVAELKRRLCGRGTESEEVIAARLARAAEEVRGLEQYEYLLINDDLDECVNALHNLIDSQHHRVSSHRETIRSLRDELAAENGQPEQTAQ